MQRDRWGKVRPLTRPVMPGELRRRWQAGPRHGVRLGRRRRRGDAREVSVRPSIRSRLFMSEGQHRTSLRVTASMAFVDGRSIALVSCVCSLVRIAWLLLKSAVTRR